MATHVAHSPPSHHPTRSAIIRKISPAKFYLPSPGLPRDYRCRQFTYHMAYQTTATMNIQRQLAIIRPTVNESRVHPMGRAPKTVSPQCDLFFQASTVDRASADVLSSNLKLRMVNHVPISGSRDRGEQIQQVLQIAQRSISEQDSATADGGGEDGGHGGSFGGYSGGYRGGSDPDSGEGWSDEGRGGNAPLLILLGGTRKTTQRFKLYPGISQAFTFDNYQLIPEVSNCIMYLHRA